MSEPVQDADALRRRADSLRDQRLWREAAAAYGAFLALRPEDAGMRVQQGHCLKEAGDLEGALALYREAAAQRPRDADIPLQIGHAEKLRGRMDAAREAYARAVLLAPGAQNPWREWSALMRQEAGRVTAPAGGVVLDLSDLAAWVRGGRRAPSGIQRVQLDLVRAALGRAVPPRLCAMPPGAGGMGGGGWRDWPVALFTRIDHLMTSGADAEDPEWRAAALLLEGVLSAAPPLRFAPGAVLAPLGGSWSQPDHLACLRAARARDGLRHVPLLHDCIPLLLPEHCAERVTQDYARWFSALPLHAEGVVAVSQATAEDMRALMARHLPDLPVPPAAVLRLDAAPRAVVPEPHPIAAAGRPYVLFVSTIEGRKNHLMVFNAWLALLRRLGAAAVPLLVCVGRPGWRAGAAMSLLEASTALRGKVRLLSDVSDPQLAALYQGCLFTLYNSHHEGWGLPVTESLAHGRLALVPAHSALTEAGEGGALFFAPGSEPDLVAQLTRLITEPGFRAAAEAAIRPPGRDWAAVADRFLTEAARLAATAPPPPAPCPAPGLPHPLARLEGEAPGLPMALAEALRDGEGWHPLEAWGCWTRPGPARLCLELPPGMEGALEVQIGLRAPEGAAVEADLLPLREGAPPAGARRVALPAGGRGVASLGVAPGGRRLWIEIASPATALEEREIGIGVTSLGHAAADAVGQRLDLLEARHFRRARVVAEGA